jgi:hypothetical protein
MPEANSMMLLGSGTGGPQSGPGAPQHKQDVSVKASDPIEPTLFA